MMTGKHPPTYSGYLFQTTCWTDLVKVQADDQQQVHSATEKLATRYWKPVYAYLKRKGYSHADSLDLTQSFFHEIVLEKNLFSKANKAKGRFRTYLLTTLQHFLAEQYRKKQAKKRSPRTPLGHLNTDDGSEIDLVDPNATPEQAFLYTWATALLDRALHEIEQEYRLDNKAVYWLIFEARVVRPILDGSPAPSLKELCEQYQIDTAKKASNMLITVKRRFEGILKRILQETMEEDSCVEDELTDLIQVLSQLGAA